MNKKLYVLVLFTLISHFLFNTISPQKESINEIEIIRFMGLYQYPRSVDEKIFWDFPEEHASFKIRIDMTSKTFLDDIKEFKSAKDVNFYEFEYALLIKKGNKTDTIYSDHTLKYWKHKINGSYLNYYDDSYPLFIRENYSFFSDCW